MYISKASVKMSIVSAQNCAPATSNMAGVSFGAPRTPRSSFCDEVEGENRRTRAEVLAQVELRQRAAKVKLARRTLCNTCQKKAIWYVARKAHVDAY